MKRERVTLTKWRMESGTMVRAGEYYPGGTLPPYDWLLTDDTISIGRISIQAIDDDNKFKTDNVEIVIQNASKHIPALALGIDYGFFADLASPGYYYEVTIEIQAAASDDAHWMVLGLTADIIPASYLADAPGIYEDGSLPDEKWVAVLGGYIVPSTLQIDEREDTITFNVGAYDLLLEEQLADLGGIKAYETPRLLLRLIAARCGDYGWRTDVDLIELPDFAMITRAISAGPSDRLNYIAPGGYIVAMARISATEYYCVTQDGSGWRGNPVLGWTAATLSMLPLYHEIDPDTGEGTGGLFSPEQSGYANLSSVPGWDVDALGFPNRSISLDNDNWCGEGFYWAGMSAPRWVKLRWSDGLSLYYVPWIAVGGGGGVAFPVSVDGIPQPTADIMVVVQPIGSHWAVYMCMPSSDSVYCLYSTLSAAYHNPTIGEVMQWSYAPDRVDVEILVFRHEDHGHRKAGWHCGNMWCGDAVATPGLHFQGYGWTPHESVQNLPKGKAIRTADATNPTGYRWTCPAKNDDGTATLWVYDDHWQLVDKIDFGPVYSPPVADDDAAYRDYFGCTTDGQWIFHEDRIYGYGQTSAPAVRIDRPADDAEDADLPTWSKVLTDTCRQIFCAWWIRPDQTLRVKQLWQGDETDCEAAKLVENAKWGIWSESARNLKLSYGSNGDVLTLGLTGESKEVDCPLTSTRSMARWLAGQYWSVFCGGLSAATFNLRLFCTEIFNRISYGADWCLTKLELYNSRDQIYTEAEAITQPVNGAAVLASLKWMIYWNPNIDPTGWTYDDDAGFAAHFGGCADRARALYSAWCAILNASATEIRELAAAQDYLMEHYTEWATLAAALDTCRM